MQTKKEDLLIKFKKLRSDFYSHEKDIYKDFHSLSFNEILFFKRELSYLSFRIRKIANVLNRRYGMNIDLEIKND
ncbi:hypothetical protein [Aliarcobacter thereius]|uniref:hypothetical protein n=1 Tax=Aliarcobacter thereius TaxID=544718 RepID=UPI000824E8D8|nr:hypothetical protein [Aliarcobacter thereius]OCL90571.1 hypothetical protein AAX25_01669 [Aliarcobacter thereius]